MDEKGLGIKTWVPTHLLRGFLQCSDAMPMISREILQPKGSLWKDSILDFNLLSHLPGILQALEFVSPTIFLSLHQRE